MRVSAVLILLNEKVYKYMYNSLQVPTKDFNNAHTVYPVTPNAGMFYQRGYKH